MHWRISSLVKAFKAPKSSLGNLDADSAGALIAASTDVALILDSHGVIRDLAFQSDELTAELAGQPAWVGRSWLDVVTVESRPKVETLLRDASAGSEPRWRHVNHPSLRGPDVPILYSALQIGTDGRVVAFGRDLRAISALQQRLVDAQQSMERDYSRLRHVETRYRLLFQMSPEPVLIVDAMTMKVAEANPAATALLGEKAGRAVARPFADVFRPESVSAVQALLVAVRSGGRPDEVRARLPDDERDVMVSASMFRQENASLFLVRLVAVQQNVVLLPQHKSKLLKAVENSPDGFVVAAQDGSILSANAAFLEMAEISSEEQALDQPLERWVGRQGVDLEVLMTNLRQRGSVRLFATTLRGEFGASAEVEISAVSVMNGGQPCYGFAIRNVGRRLTVADTRAGRELPRSVEQLTELIGRVSLKDLVRETTDVIERLCIEAALELTGDNRASAAEMLGLSRQSLYVKLRRYGLGDLATEGRD